MTKQLTELSVKTVLITLQFNENSYPVQHFSLKKSLKMHVYLTAPITAHQKKPT